MRTKEDFFDGKDRRRVGLYTLNIKHVNSPSREFIERKQRALSSEL